MLLNNVLMSYLIECAVFYIKLLTDIQFQLLLIIFMRDFLITWKIIIVLSLYLVSMRLKKFRFHLLNTGFIFRNFTIFSRLRGYLLVKKIIKHELHAWLFTTIRAGAMQGLKVAYPTINHPRWASISDLISRLVKIASNFICISRVILLLWYRSTLFFIDNVIATTCLYSSNIYYPERIL